MKKIEWMNLHKAIDEKIQKVAKKNTAHLIKPITKQMATEVMKIIWPIIDYYQVDELNHFNKLLEQMTAYDFEMKKEALMRQKQRRATVKK